MIDHAYDGFLRPKTGLLPKFLPEEHLLTIEDVHRGPFHIWVGMQGTVFVDIDGTVADLEHRRKYVASKPKNYPAFERGIRDDRPIMQVINTVIRLYEAGWTVVMCSGRREVQREATVAWLSKHNVPYHALYMRHEFEYEVPGDPSSGVKKSRKGGLMPDYRADYIVKKELLDQARSDGYDPDVVFDDRDQVVQMWRDNGIPVVQVAEGDF